MVTRRKSKQRKHRLQYEPARNARIEALIAGGYIANATEIPAEAIPAAMELQSAHNSYSPRIYYADEAFDCRDCGKAQVWTAAQQRWWYEQCKGTIYSMALYCRECRRKRRERKEAHRLATLAGIERKRARAAKKGY